MIYLFTDFGSADIYVGQVKAELARVAHAIPVIDLLHDAPAFNVTANAHLLAALSSRIEPGSIVMAVVDPGVGTPRRPVVLTADGVSFVGPDNGLLSLIAARSMEQSTWEIVWRPKHLSRSFHGRDLFAPIAGWLASGGLPRDALRPVPALDIMLVAADLAEIIYVDHYGNAFTGMRADASVQAGALTVRGTTVRPAAVFAEAAAGQPFWYINSLGLVEIACNQLRAAEQLGLNIGDTIRFESSY